MLGFGETCGFAVTADKQDGDLCAEISADEPSCAASSTGFSVKFTWDEVQECVSRRPSRARALLSLSRADGKEGKRGCVCNARAPPRAPPRHARRYVTALLDADPKQGDALQCPSYSTTWFEHEGDDDATKRKLNSTDNRQELNVSHVLERNSTHSRGDANRSSSAGPPGGR